MRRLVLATLLVAAPSFAADDLDRIRTKTPLGTINTSCLVPVQCSGEPFARQGGFDSFTRQVLQGAPELRRARIGDYGIPTTCYVGCVGGAADGDQCSTNADCTGGTCSNTGNDWGTEACPFRDVWAARLHGTSDAADTCTACGVATNADFATLAGSATNADNLTLDPADCGANVFATAIDRQADLTCSAITDAAVPDNITVTGPPAVNANLTGPITSVGNATAVAAQTGTGSTFVMNTDPTIEGLRLLNSSGWITVISPANTANRALSIPDSGAADTFVLRTLAQTLVNKTLTSPTIAKIGNLTTNGLVTTSGGDGTLGVDTSTYLTTGAAAAAYQPLDADLTSWAGVTRASGFDTFAATPSSANLASLLTDETFSMADAELGAIAGLTSAANKVPRFTGSGTADLLDFKDEDNMASDSDTAVASQQSIKAYVDARRVVNLASHHSGGNITTTKKYWPLAGTLANGNATVGIAVVPSPFTGTLTKFWHRSQLAPTGGEVVTVGVRNETAGTETTTTYTAAGVHAWTGSLAVTEGDLIVGWAQITTGSTTITLDTQAWSCAGTSSN